MKYSEIKISIIVFLLIVGCTKKKEVSESNPALGERTFVEEEGGRIYAKYCSPCHGEEGKGDGKYFASGLEPKPPDFTDEKFQKDSIELFNSIKNGSASMGQSKLCPPWGNTLEESEIRVVLSYTLDFSKKK